jgi:DNA-binding NtrC family response regulator
MVVDDEHDILQVMRAGLTRYGHNVMVFSDPLLAMKEFALNHCDYKLILTDLRMPSMSGIELAKKAREIDPDVKLLIMTAFELTSYEILYNLPFVRPEEVLKKPISMQSVCKVIDQKTHT